MKEMSKDALDILALRDKQWERLDKQCFRGIEILIDKRNRERKNSENQDFILEKKLFAVMYMDLCLRRAKRTGQSILEDKDAINFLTQLPKLWENLDEDLEHAERILEDKIKKIKRGGYIDKDLRLSISVLSIACAELNIRRSERMKEPIGIKL